MSKLMTQEFLNWQLNARGNLFALIDAAEGDVVADVLKDTKFRSQILYNGELANLLSDTGPHLVDLGRNLESSPFLQAFQSLRPHALFIVTELSFDLLRNHLRHFTAAFLPDDERVLFAFYDPRVFNAFMAIATEAQRSDFLLGIHSIAYQQIDEYGEERFLVSINEFAPKNRLELANFHFTADQLVKFDLEFKKVTAHRVTKLVFQKMKYSVRDMSYADAYRFVENTTRHLYALTEPSMATILRFVSLSIHARRPITLLAPVLRYLTDSSDESIDEKLRVLSRHFAKKRTMPARKERGSL